MMIYFLQVFLQVFLLQNSLKVDLKCRLILSNLAHLYLEIF